MESQKVAETKGIDKEIIILYLSVTYPFAIPSFIYPFAIQSFIFCATSLNVAISIEFLIVVFGLETLYLPFLAMHWMARPRTEMWHLYDKCSKFRQTL